MEVGKEARGVVAICLNEKGSVIAVGNFFKTHSKPGGCTLKNYQEIMARKSLSYMLAISLMGEKYAGLTYDIHDNLLRQLISKGHKVEYHYIGWDEDGGN